MVNINLAANAVGVRVKIIIAIGQVNTVYMVRNSFHLQKLLKIAIAMQAHIPFDFIASGIRPFNTGRFTDTGYLRTGFNEYQFIGEKELMTMAGLTESALYTIVENSQPGNKAGIYGAADENSDGYSFRQIPRIFSQAVVCIEELDDERQYSRRTRHELR